MKRISFNQYDAEHLYDLCLSNFILGCYQCELIKKRLEKFIGEEAVKFHKKMVKEHPYK